MNLNPHTIVPIICLLLATICGLFVVTKNPRAKLNRIFFFICLDIAAWMSFYIAFNLNLTQEALLLWFKISYCFISFIPIMCFTLLTVYTNSPRNGTWFKINSILGVLLCILSLFSDLVVSGVYYLPWYPYPMAGPLHIILVIHCGILAVLSLKVMADCLKDSRTSPKAQSHLKYMFTGILILSIGMIDFLGNYGVHIYNLGPFADILFLSIVTTAIVKYQFLDIRIAVKKGLVYSFLISVITIIYLLTVLILERLFSGYMRWQELTGSILSAIVIAIIFIPLRNWLQRIVDHMLFKNSTPEIAEQNEQLRQELITTEKFKAVATLASGLAHEIKNPLTALKTFSEYLPSKMKDEEFLKKFAPIIGSEVDRINSLVHELLDFAKPSPVELKSVAIHSLIDQTIEILSNNFVKSRIQVNKHYRLAPSAHLNIDPNQMKQAFLNIFLNAIDAMPSGGALNIETKRLSNNHTAIIIGDTGEGIKSAEINQIFDPFFSTKDHGTGLGLAITQEIIKNHKGRILVESEMGIGTTFTIHLPYNS